MGCEKREVGDGDPPFTGSGNTAAGSTGSTVGILDLLVMCLTHPGADIRYTILELCGVPGLKIYIYRVECEAVGMDEAVQTASRVSWASHTQLGRWDDSWIWAVVVCYGCMRSCRGERIQE